MDSETPYTALAPPVFDGDNYQIWAARMEAHLEANDLWEAVEEDYKVLPLPTNPTMAQIKNNVSIQETRHEIHVKLATAAPTNQQLKILPINK